MQHFIEIFESDIEKWHEMKGLLNPDIESKYDAIVMKNLLDDYLALRKERFECHKGNCAVKED